MMFSLKDPSTTGVACKKAKVNCRLQIYICSAEDAMVDRMMSGAFTQSQPGFLQLRFHPSGDRIDSIAVTVFADIFIELTNTVKTVSDNKIQITILIL